MLILFDKIWMKGHEGGFFNYVDNIFAFFNHLPTPGWHLGRIFFTFIRENLHTTDISSTISPTYLVLST